MLATSSGIIHPEGLSFHRDEAMIYVAFLLFSERLSTAQMSAVHTVFSSLPESRLPYESVIEPLPGVAWLVSPV